MRYGSGALLRRSAYAFQIMSAEGQYFRKEVPKSYDNKRTADKRLGGLRSARFFLAAFIAYCSLSGQCTLRADSSHDRIRGSPAGTHTIGNADSMVGVTAEMQAWEALHMHLEPRDS